MNEKSIKKKFVKRKSVSNTEIQKSINISNAIYYNELIFKIEKVLLSIKHRNFKRNKKILKDF